MFCKKCGSEILEIDKFCIKCGISLDYLKEELDIKEEERKYDININIKATGDQAIKSITEGKEKEEDRWDFRVGLAGAEINYLLPPKFKEYLMGFDEWTEIDADALIVEKRQEIEYILLIFMIILKDYLIYPTEPKIVIDGLLKIQDKIHKGVEKTK